MKVRSAPLTSAEVSGSIEAPNPGKKSSMSVLSTPVKEVQGIWKDTKSNMSALKKKAGDYVESRGVRDSFAEAHKYEKQRQAALKQEQWERDQAKEAERAAKLVARANRRKVLHRSEPRS
jgi:hypothetical protein